MNGFTPSWPCPKCRARNAAGTTTCRRCGTTIPEVTADVE